MVDRNYLDNFFGNLNYLAGADEEEMKTCVASLRKQWEWDGDYEAGVDPSEADIVQAAMAELNGAAS